MRAAASRRGVPITHRARKFRREDFSDFDLVVTMDRENFDDVLALAPDDAARAKVRPMVAWLRRHSAECIPDPYYGGSAGFEHVLDLLEDACAGLLEELAAR